MLCCLCGIINPINLNLSNKFAPHQSLPLLRAKCRATPGCALYARLRAGVPREVDSPLGEDGGRENYPSVTLGKRDSSPDKGSLGHR